MGLNVKWHRSKDRVAVSKYGAFRIIPTTYGPVRDIHAGFEMETPLNVQFGNTHKELKQHTEKMVQNAKQVLILSGYQMIPD